jgi:hypothetical protein
VHKSGYRGTAKNVRSGYRSGRRWSTALVTVVVAAVGSISLLALGGLTAVPASAATAAPAVSQCNADSFPTGAGYQVTCTVSVENYTTATGATSSTVTTSACLAAAGVVFPSCPLNLGPVTSTVTSTQLVTSVNQCNGIVNGAGSNVYCDVTVTDNVPAGSTTSGATVDQCIGSAATSTEACAPLGSTTNATVTQCNGSANGGGTYAGQPAAGCTVTGTDAALPVTINQCNGTSNGGGSAVTCMATVADVFVPASTTTTTTATGTGGTAAAGGKSPTGGLAGGSGGAVGAGGSTGTGSGIGGATGTVASVIPTGAPQTGFGGASLSTNPALVYMGSIALAAAGLTMVLAIRRRRSPVVSSRQSHLS